MSVIAVLRMIDPRALGRGALVLLGLAAIALPGMAFGQDRGSVSVTREDGYVRLILNFEDRRDLPDYGFKVENGVLAVSFAEPAEIRLPDIAAAVPEYVAVARTDPNGGLRLGLKTALNVNHIEAGEKLFIDLMPTTWQGALPTLPEDVVAELARRAKEAAMRGEQARKAKGAAELKPVADVRVAVNPTFMRVMFNWSTATTAEYKLESEAASVNFEWPVPIDLIDLKTALLSEIKSVEDVVTLDGSKVVFNVAQGVVPRFYKESDTNYIIDIDIAEGQESSATLAQLTAAHEAKLAEQAKANHEAANGNPDIRSVLPAGEQGKVTPFVNMAGSTVRVVFPFDQDTPAAVFRRGDTVWLMFDTSAEIAQPNQADQLAAVASQFAVTPTGDTQVVRIDLASDRLATLASEGRAWVLSLGDILLSATEPMRINRRLDGRGRYEMTADLERPGRVHQFRDPDAGDVLTVVTAYPPSRNLVRGLDFVDFSALRSVHGLVIKPNNETLDVGLESKLAVIRADDGLTVSSAERSRSHAIDFGEAERDGFIDLAMYRHEDATVFTEHEKVIMSRTSTEQGPARDRARLDLAQLYLANDLSYEAIGVLRIMEAQIKDEELKMPARITMAAADTMAGRPLDALAILNSEAMTDFADGLIWRTMAYVDAGDFRAARADAMAAESLLENYPSWLRTRFLFAAARASVETNDGSLADRYLAMIDITLLDTEELSLFRLLSGRIDEIEGRMQEALETYGEVISAEVRPTHAEAVYRTISVLDQTGKLDLVKGTQTLAAESMLWRGNSLEADMQKLLADLYFRDGQYRLGFETVKQAVQYYPNSKPVDDSLDRAQAVFSDLYLHGAADKLDPVDALGIYYDFRNLTPPGARGDEMIRNLARRLVKVDLLTQAGDLLEYQIDNRLKGAAQAQIAADLAVIEIADRKPEAALRVLNKTRMPDLAPSLERQRRVLEARAFIDAGRDELALDLVSKMDGRDVELLRVDAHWKGRRYATAAETIEAIYAPELAAGPLSQTARMSVVRAAVGYVLAGDALGLARVRTKFGDGMAKTPEWPMFDYVTGEISPTSREFRKVAEEVAGLDALNAFLGAYRDIYGKDDAMTPLNATKPDGNQPQA